MKTVALVTYDRLPHLSPSDKMLCEELTSAGMHVESVVWNNKTIDWNRFDAVVVRSTWDYHHKIAAFTDWINHLEYNMVPVWNPLPTIRWNREKTYLQDLEKGGASCIPTVWIGTQENVDLGNILKEQEWEMAVIKPTIGASAEGVTLVKYAQMQQGQRLLNTILKKTGAMVQKFVPEIKTEGELSLIYICDALSHTVQKIPAEKDFRSNYDFRAQQKIIIVDSDIQKQVKKILELVPYPCLYARIDGIVVAGVFMLMEVELIEPHLFFDLYPAGARAFTEELQQLLKRV